MSFKIIYLHLTMNCHFEILVNHDIQFLYWEGPLATFVFTAMCGWQWLLKQQKHKGVHISRGLPRQIKSIINLLHENYPQLCYTYICCATSIQNPMSSNIYQEAYSFCIYQCILLNWNNLISKVEYRVKFHVFLWTAKTGQMMVEFSLRTNLVISNW